MLILKNKITIVFIVIIILFIIVIYLFNGKFDSNMKQKADYVTAELIKTSIVLKLPSIISASSYSRKSINFGIF